MAAESITPENNNSYNINGNFSGSDDGNNTVFNGFPPRRPPPPPLPPLHDFQKYSYPITIAFGLIGNSLIFYIFTRTKLKKPSTSRYLAAAAVADTGFLFTSLFFNLDRYHNVSIFSTIGPCQLIMFANNVFTFLSTWYLTSVMIEKYIGVSWPRKKTRLCTVFRAKCVIIALAVLSLVCYLYITWFFGVVHFKSVGITMCTLWLDPGIQDAWTILTRMDAIVNFAIPYIIIFIMSCLIAYHTWQYRKTARTAGERFLRRQRATTAADKDFKTTPLLLLLAASTLILCTPNNVNRMREFFYKHKEIRQPSVEGPIFHYMYVVNFAVKILVYTASSKAFVKEIGYIVCSLGKVLTRHDSRNSSNELLENGCNNETKTIATSTEGEV